MTNLAITGLLLLVPMLLCGALTVWRGYVCEPEPRRGSRLAFAAFCAFYLSVFMFFAVMFLLMVGTATHGSDSFVSTCATLGATGATLGLAALISNWAKTRRSELQLLARFDADDWWKSKRYESPEDVRAAIAALPHAPYPRDSNFPPAATRAMYRAAWTYAFIHDELRHRDSVGLL